MAQQTAIDWLRKKLEETLLELIEPIVALK